MTFRLRQLNLVLGVVGLALSSLAGCERSSTLEAPRDMLGSPADLLNPCGSAFCSANQVCVVPPCCCFGDLAGIPVRCAPGQTCRRLVEPFCVELPDACKGTPSCACGFFSAPCDSQCDNASGGRLECKCAGP